MTGTTDVLVVGGGIGGLATALYVARRTGRAVRVLERAPQFEEIGAGLQFGPNATRIMDELGFLDQLLEQSVLPAAAEVREATTLERLTRVDLGQGFVDRFGYPYLVVHRGDLLDLLLEGCRADDRISLHTDSEVVEVLDDDEIVRVVCADGTTYDARLVVGADGVHSQLRKRLVQDEIVHSGFVAFRGTIPVAELGASALSSDVVLYVGHDMHLVQYPIRHGELYNQVAVFGVTEQERDGTIDDIVGAFERQFAPSHPQVLDHARRMVGDRFWPIVDRDPITHWIKGRTVLIGDAAHPMLQYLGQGACQALEDARALADCLASIDDPDVALTTFQERRIGRTTKCQRSARPWGETWHTDDMAMKGLRDRVFRHRADDDYSEFDWLYLPQP